MKGFAFQCISKGWPFQDVLDRIGRFVVFRKGQPFQNIRERLVFVCKCSVHARACVRACEMECGITFLVIFFEKRLRMQLYSDVGPPGILKMYAKVFSCFQMYL